jgi:hypothetical protein
LGALDGEVVTGGRGGSGVDDGCLDIGAAGVDSGDERVEGGVGGLEVVGNAVDGEGRLEADVMLVREGSRTMGREALLMVLVEEPRLVTSI